MASQTAICGARCFCDGGNTYRLRFASTQPDGEWQWRLVAGKSMHGTRTVRPRESTIAPHHRNDEHQDADWLDFQSCQTGHTGDHVPDRLATMWAQQPVKAIMNGEPSYEHNGRPGVAEGWWQGHEAWSNLCAGALMGCRLRRSKLVAMATPPR